MKIEKKCISFLLFALFAVLTIQAQVTIGSDVAPSRAALLDLKTQIDADPDNGGVTSTRGGLLLPRVSLVDTRSLAPFIAGGGTNAEKRAHKGMNVYHIGGNGIDPGQYVWDGTQWLLLLTGIPPTPINTSFIRDLQRSVMVPLSRWHDPAGGAELDFGALPITEAGSYAVTLRLYGGVYKDEAMTGRVDFHSSTSIYIWLFRSGQATHVDAAEISGVVLNSTSAEPNTYVLAFTTSLTVPWAEAGETLSIRIATNPVYPNFRWHLGWGIQPAAARTSLFYWKL